MNKYLIFLIDKSYKHHQSKTSGFTLIELLVVILILGILASISLASMLNMISKARETEAITNLNYCTKQQQTYYLENTKFTESLETIGLPNETKNYIYKTEIFPPTKPEDGNQTLACCMATEKGGTEQMVFTCVFNN